MKFFIVIILICPFLFKNVNKVQRGYVKQNITSDFAFDTINLNSNLVGNWIYSCSLVGDTVFVLDSLIHQSKHLSFLERKHLKYDSVKSPSIGIGYNYLGVTYKDSEHGENHYLFGKYFFGQTSTDFLLKVKSYRRRRRLLEEDVECFYIKRLSIDSLIMKDNFVYPFFSDEDGELLHVFIRIR